MQRGAELSPGASVVSLLSFCCLSASEPQVGIEPTTARLRIECSTTELLWRVPLGFAPAGVRITAREPTNSPCPGSDSNRDAFPHHPLKMACLPVSPPGLSYRQTTDKQQTNNRQTTDKPQTNHRQTTDKPQTNHRQTTDKQQRNNRQTTERERRGSNPRPLE